MEASYGYLPTHIRSAGYNAGHVETHRLLAVPAARRNSRGRNAIGDLQVQPESSYIFAIVARGLSSRAEPPVHLPGTAPRRDRVASRSPHAGDARDQFFGAGHGATGAWAQSLPIKNIVVGLPYPAVPGGCRKPDANRSYARSRKPLAPTAVRTLPRDGSDGSFFVGEPGRPTAHPQVMGCGTQDPAESLEGHSRRSAHEPDTGQALPRPWANTDEPCGHRPLQPVSSLMQGMRKGLPISRDSRSVCGAHQPNNF